MDMGIFESFEIDALSERVEKLEAGSNAQGGVFERVKKLGGQFGVDVQPTDVIRDGLWVVPFLEKIDDRLLKIEDQISDLKLLSIL
jgi:hypothetical protein